MTISQDLRIRIVKMVLSGMSRRQAATRFAVSPSSGIRFVQRHEEDGICSSENLLRFIIRLLQSWNGP